MADISASPSSRTKSLLEPLQQSWALPLLTLGAGLGNWYWAMWGSVVSHGLMRGAAGPMLFLPAFIAFHLYGGIALSQALAGVESTPTKMRHALFELLGCAMSFLYLCSIESSVPVWSWTVGCLAICFGVSPALEALWAWVHHKRRKRKSSAIRIAATASMLIQKAQRLVSSSSPSATGGPPLSPSNSLGSVTNQADEPSASVREFVFTCVAQKDGLPLVGPSVDYQAQLSEFETGTTAFQTMDLDARASLPHAHTHADVSIDSNQASRSLFSRDLEESGNLDLSERPSVPQQRLVVSIECTLVAPYRQECMDRMNHKPAHRSSLYVKRSANWYTCASLCDCVASLRYLERY